METHLTNCVHCSEGQRSLPVLVLLRVAATDLEGL